MRMVIIEDEKPAYNRITKLIKESIPNADIIAHLDSVKQSVEWFSNNPLPDVVFLDIHLADGSCFDLLKVVDVSCPIIYTTAYDQYAMDAFKTTGIDYLLKPVKKEELQNALQKLTTIKAFLKQQEKVAIPSQPVNATTGKEYKKRFVVRFGEHIKTLQVEDVAYFFSENKATFARTVEGRTLPMDNNLDTLEQMLNPHDFFRINRQYLIALKAIDDMKTYSKARVIVTLKPAVKEQPVVSSERSAEFKHWLAGEL